MGTNRKRDRAGYSKPLINEHDLTKNMLNFMREGVNQEEGGEGKEKEGSIVLDGPEIKDEMNKLEDFVGSRIKAYDELIIYPYDHNVTWGGEFLNGIRFEFNLTGDMKLDANNITVDDNEVELMTKLKKYGENWVDEWAKKLRDDYQTQSDNVRR